MKKKAAGLNSPTRGWSHENWNEQCGWRRGGKETRELTKGVLYLWVLWEDRPATRLRAMLKRIAFGEFRNWNLKLADWNEKLITEMESG